MKKISKHINFLKAAIAIALALAFFLPGATVFANDDGYDVTPEDPRPLTGNWVMIENTTARPDTTGLIVPVYANVSEEAREFLTRIYIDTAAIEVVDLNFDDCVTVPIEYRLDFHEDPFYELDLIYDPLFPSGEGQLA